LNPKTKLTNVHVYKEDLLEVFGTRCSLKLTNPLFHVETKLHLKRLHWQIYGVPTLNNNDFMLWLMKGSITQEKIYEINWAKTIASTTKKRVQKK
jgi:DNA gyrase/topoisomerase IV subunit B